MEGINDLKNGILEEILMPRRHAMLNHMPINNQDDRNASGDIYGRVFICHKTDQNSQLPFDNWLFYKKLEVPSYFLEIYRTKSTTRLEYPHSLSYQAVQKIGANGIFSFI